MLEGVTDEMMDYTPSSANVESIATLLDHIAAVEWSWIFEDIDSLKMDEEEWKFAFANRSWSKVDQRLGMGKDFYLNKLQTVRNDVGHRLEHMKDNELTNLIVSSDEEDETLFSIEWIFFHLTNHEALHLGQISLLKRLYKNTVVP